MKSILSIPFSSQTAVLVLASALSIPALAQQATPAPQQPAASAPDKVSPAAKEGFWGRVNPFARKVWVNKRTAPINARLSELDEVNAKNAKDIQDVDGRAQAGIGKAQSAAEAANQAAQAANAAAQKAGTTAQDASGRVDKLNATIGGIDQYRQVSEVEVAFKTVQPVLSAEARQQLDTLAASLTGKAGYILEIEARAPGAGSLGIQNSDRLAEAVKRYLVSEHQVPVFRLHSVALGNAPLENTADAKPVKASTVHIRLMENTLAASR